MAPVTVFLNAWGGQGGQSTAGRAPDGGLDLIESVYGRSDSGTVRVFGAAHASAGSALADADARGGDAGSNQTNNRFGGRAAGDDGDALAISRAQGANGIASERSLANGGPGGSFLSGPENTPGGGGSARAEAHASHSNGGPAIADASAGGGWSGSNGVDGFSGDLRTRAGDATAVATGDTTGAADISASAVSASGYHAGVARAHSRANAGSGRIRATARSATRRGVGRFGQTRVDLSANAPGIADILAVAYHNGAAGGRLAAPLNESAGALASSTILGDTLQDITFFAQGSPELTGAQTFTMSVALSYLEESALLFNPQSHLYVDLTELRIIGNGFDRLSLTTRLEGADIVNTFNNSIDAANFFANPVDLGVIGDPFALDNTLDIGLFLQLTISGSGDGIVLAAAPVPLPPAAWMMLAALVFVARCRWR